MKLQELQHCYVSVSGPRRFVAALVFGLLLLASGIPFGVVPGQSISLSVTYTQNFDTLANTGTTNPWTNGTSPLSGFYAGQQNGTLSTYRADNGGSNSGALYSYGATGSTERSLGSVSSGTPGTLYHGARFVNDTGGALVGLSIGYTGEQWRCGGNTTPHRIDFQYQIGPAGSIADIKSGSWTDFDALDFTGPVATATAGPLDGNDAANRLVIAPLQLPVNIPDTYEFWIRWVDVNDTGSDHGLGVDDLLVSRYGSGGVSLSVGDVTVLEGNSPTTTTATFVVSLSGPAPAGGVTFDIATADGSATTANNDYLPRSLNGVTIPEGSSSYNFDVTVNGDDTQEVTETFTATVANVVGASVLKDTGTCTITNDDFPVIPIHDVQGNGDTSPFDGVQVTVRGIVYAVTYAGFFIQALPGDYDADPLTSEGILVYTGSPVPAEAVIGNQVLVTGTVDEYYPSGDPYRFITELTNNTVIVEATGQTLPTPVTLTAAEISPTGPVNQLERYEGMRVHIDSLTTVSGTFGRWISEAQSLYASTGNFYCVLTGTPRPFREPGIEAPWPIPVPPCCIPRFDANPERVALDTDVLAGSTALDVTAGVVITNVTGPLDYAARTYTIYPEPGYTVGTNTTAQPAPMPLSTDANVAFWNMHHFYNDINDAGGDLQLTTPAYQGRLNKASLAIRNLFHTPDILAVIEMENLATLQDLANKVNADVVAGGGANPGYVPFLFEGNDPSNINVGFMVKSNVTVSSCTQIGKDDTFIREDTGTPATLHDRPPLVLMASVQPAVGPAVPLVVIVYHLRSLGGVDDIAGGVFERQKRMLQAEAIGSLAQSYQANPANLVVVGGDFNAYEFNDGWVDCMGIVRGNQVGADQVYKWSAAGDLVEPNLVELISLLPADQRYSYTYFGSAQTLDHALASQNLLPELTYFGETHVNADFPYVYRNDTTRPERLSDHDCFQLYVRSPIPQMVTQPVGGAVCIGQTFTLSCTATGKETLTYTWYWGYPGDTSTPVGTGNPLVFTPMAGSNPYYCRVSNLWGYADSSVVMVTANATTGILNQPLDETICEGEIAHLQVGALGAGLTYQWYEGTTPIFGADDYFLEVSPTVSTDYWVRVTGDCGTVDSTVATVTVNTGAAIVGATWNQSICAGTRATLSLTVSGTAPTVQWFWSPDGVNYTLIPGASSTTYTTPPLFARTVYMAQVDNACSDDQKIMVVDVVTPPAVTGVTPETLRVNTGHSALLTVFYVASEPVTIQWYEGETGDVSHPVDGATSAVFHTPQVYADTRYWARVTNACGASDSLAVPVSVWNVYYLPHVVSTSEWWTKVSIVNAGGLNPKAGEAVDEVEVRAYNSAGGLEE
ncbi:MAG: endonuclease/exonuclease/phosphatase family protein, partial [Acidobacteria bacterium]|nr:endonuclease/exonuclease/phosphatase family protein [Acidobacteriota bacterium]